jgi:hypothetical protein
VRPEEDTMAREFVVALSIVGTLSAFGTDATSQEDEPTHPAAQATLRYFESIRNEDVDALLSRLRRPAPVPEMRATVIRNLPKWGDLSPNAQEAAKLAVIRPILAFHEREHNMEVRLFTFGGIAFVGLHARTVLLISREALGLFNTDELRAIMAHELGHDYVWDDYSEARERGDDRRLQELELRCDGVAVITMNRIGLDSEHLVSAATKLAHHERLGPTNEARYVPLDQRIRFIRTLTRLTAVRR